MNLTVKPKALKIYPQQSELIELSVDLPPTKTKPQNNYNDSFKDSGREKPALTAQSNIKIKPKIKQTF